MIAVKLNEANFEYDIHSLVKAFFPKEEVAVTAENTEPEETPLFIMEVFYLAGKGNPDAIEFVIGQTIRKVTGDADFSNRPETKNKLKQTLYQLLSEYTGTTLPWGNLTGIRPTKLTMGFLEAGKTADWIRDYMSRTYFTSPEKIELSIEIAERERKLLAPLDYEDGYSLYIGIPFCPSTCLYCSFTSYPLGQWAQRMDEYLDALEKEIDFTKEAFAGKKLNTIYIGGGTPTTLTADQSDRLLTKLGRSFDFSSLAEYTVEAGRPDSITGDKLETLKKHGITRISINPQTMKQETLDLIGRRHTVDQTKESFLLARSLGFDNINMDLIIGLPEETIEDVKRTMEQLKVLDPDSITVHSLAVKRAARLRMFKEEYAAYHMVNTPEIIDLTAGYARESGLLPYYLYRQKNMAGNFENVGYARAGKEGIYNILIMEEKQTIMALGAGAATKFVFSDGSRIERTENVKDIGNYLARVDEMIERKRSVLERWLKQHTKSRKEE